MNEVKKSLQSVAGDVSKDKETLKQSIRHKKKKPKRRNPFPLVATTIVLVAVILLAFNLLQDGSLNKKAYTVDESLYDLMLKSEQLDQGDSDEVRYRVFQGILEIDSTMAYAASLGYEEDLEEINTIINEQRQTYYDDFTEEQLKELKQTQIDNFGYTYDQYFEVLLTHTQRYTNAMNWLERNRSEDETMQRQVLDSFQQEHQQVIKDFMEKKSIPDLAEQFSSRKYDGIVASINQNQVLIVQGLEPKEYAGLTPEEIIAAAYESVWFDLNESIDGIKLDKHIEVTFDPLSYAITKEERPQRYYDVIGWNNYTQ